MLGILTAITCRPYAMQMGMRSLHGHRSANELTLLHSADIGIPTRRLVDKFPLSQHRPSLISSPFLTAPIACKPVKRCKFRKANWETFKQMTDVTPSQLYTTTRYCRHKMPTWHSAQCSPTRLNFLYQITTWS